MSKIFRLHNVTDILWVVTPDDSVLLVDQTNGLVTRSVHTPSTLQDEVVRGTFVMVGLDV